MDSRPFARCWGYGRADLRPGLRAVGVDYLLGISLWRSTGLAGVSWRLDGMMKVMFFFLDLALLNQETLMKV